VKLSDIICVLVRCTASTVPTSEEVEKQLVNDFRLFFLWEMDTQFLVGAPERFSAISLQIAFTSNRRPTALKSSPQIERTGH
jgi:hypothetical protein